MSETVLSKDAICREYIRLGAALPKDAPAEARARLGALQAEAEGVVPTDVQALTHLAEALAAYKQEREGSTKTAPRVSRS